MNEVLAGMPTSKPNTQPYEYSMKYKSQSWT